MQAQAPYEILRTYLSGTFVLACTKGTGEVLMDGKWQDISAGQACLLPPFTTNAFRAKEGGTWEFAWVRYMEEENKSTVANALTPLIDTYNATSLKLAIQGLLDELSHDAARNVLPAWVNTIHQLVLKFTKPVKIDERLHSMLTMVAPKLDYPWTLIELADQCNLSPEHLRRLCNQQLGRSPMQQLTSMRMMLAKKLLLETAQPIPAIAKAVGYESPFSFSNTFLKWVGCRPSELRA